MTLILWCFYYEAPDRQCLGDTDREYTAHPRLGRCEDGWMTTKNRYRSFLN